MDTMKTRWLALIVVAGIAAPVAVAHGAPARTKSPQEPAPEQAWTLPAHASSPILTEDNVEAEADSVEEPEAEETTSFLGGKLADTVLGQRLEAAAIDVEGWTAMSFTPASQSGDLLPMGLNYRGNEFLLQQNWLRVNRGADRDEETAGWGFRSDWILPGSDYRFNVARGLWDGQLTADAGGPNRYGIDPAQFYGELWLPDVSEGLKLRAGRFFAPYGVESLAAVDSPLGSRSYTFFYNPFTQTGLLGDLKVSDQLSLKGGVVLGNDVFIDPAASPHGVLGLRWTPRPEGPTMDLTAIVGRGEFDVAEQFHNPQIFDLVVTTPLDDDTTWVVEGLYGFTNDVPGLGYASWYGVVNYLNRTLNETTSAKLRLEFFDDCDGQRTGFAGLYTAATAGVAWQPVRWLQFRPELRLDHNDARPFAGDRALFTSGLEAIIRW